jgi:glutamate--cysteine ligase
MRGADAGRPDMMLAQSALWVGLLYDDAALTAAEALLRNAGWEAAAAMREAVPVHGLATKLPWREGDLRELARDVVAIACDGLRARSRRDSAGRDESVYLMPLEVIAAGAPTQAEHWLERFHGTWGANVREIFAESAI